jgi:UDP-N-acetylmuramoylalanine--D-glutamate ligase
MVNVRGKRVLVFGLGLLGGGLATTRWLLKKGAIVRVTDSKDATTLAPSLRAIGTHKHLSFTLGEHKEEDVYWANLVVVNPGVPKESPYLTLARKLRKPLWNDTALFFATTKRPIIAVTGTRGKTTTTEWIAELLSTSQRRIYATGNTPQNPFLLEAYRKVSANTPVVAELSSWQLELLPVSKKAPRISVITNLYPDHLNRYRDIQEYADAKANIFKDQKKTDILILSRDQEWTPYFLKKKPKGKIYVVATGALKKGENGIGVVGGNATLFLEKTEKVLCSIERFRIEHGEHNLINLLQALLVVSLADPRLHIYEKDILKLAAPRFRQEIVLRKKGLLVVNDTTATSPDGTIAAIRRFSRLGNVVLITGGTDKKLEFSHLANEIIHTIPSGHVVLLGGSATEKLKQELGNFSTDIQECQTLEECVKYAFSFSKNLSNAIIVFSPGAASFEKFKNEFDRGEQFNTLVKGKK